MTKSQEYIKQQAVKHMNSKPNGCPTCFASGAALMLGHMKGFAEWIVENGWSVTDYRDKEIRPTWHKATDTAPLSTSELIDIYFDQLPKTV